MDTAKSRKIKWIVGLVLHVLIGALMVMAGAFKLFGTMPKEAMEEMSKSGIADKLTLIGAGELIAGLILIVPMTSKFGALVASGFWGGVICIHLAHNQTYIPWTIALVLTWVGAYLRNPEMMPGKTQVAA